jgi:FkbM family methyltransferase
MAHQLEPVLFTALKSLCRSPLRGGDRLFSLAERFNLLQGSIRYEIDGEYPIYVPIRRRWDIQDLLDYETPLFELLAERAKSISGEITLIDCGADIGLFSIRALSKIPTISNIIAFEPNADVFTLLEKTLSEQTCQAVALQQGVADFAGYGELKSPNYDQDDTGRFVIPAATGFRVTTLDDAIPDRPRRCIIKIDVEGGELAVIRGGRKCIEDAETAILTIEAHPNVANRTGVDPCSVFRALREIRRFDFIVAEAEFGSQTPDIDRPFFEQFAPTTIYNVVCTTVP